MLEEILTAVGAGSAQPVYLVWGDLVLAEPAARRLAEAVAGPAGCPVEVRRQPPRLAPLLDDLRTYSLFSSAKVVLAIDSAALADRSAAADLIDEAETALPPGEAGELTAAARQGASRLLQALRLFDLDPWAGEPERMIGELPGWVLEGGKALRRSRPRGRKKQEAAALAEGLALLLAAARAEGLTGWADDGLAALAAAIRDGLPPGHTLVLAERSVAEDHPVVALLAERRALVRAGEVASERRGGWRGLEAVAGQLAGETGVGIDPDALGQLARRTLRQGQGGRGGEGQGAAAESTARLAGEYRKLAQLARGMGARGTGARGMGARGMGARAEGAGAAGSGEARIDLGMVEAAVEDRGEEDVWQILDAVGAGRPGEALERLRRHLAASADPVSARLAFFGLVASFCRQLTAVRGMMRQAGVRGGESHYGRFKDRVAPKLQAALPDGRGNPLAGLHPFRLHRAYLAASRLPEEEAALLPWRVLETELRLKGESGDPDAALASLLAQIATAGR